jgi:hypothetical protein
MLRCSKTGHFRDSLKIGLDSATKRLTFARSLQKLATPSGHQAVSVKHIGSSRIAEFGRTWNGFSLLCSPNLWIVIGGRYCSQRLRQIQHPFRILIIPSLNEYESYARYQEKQRVPQMILTSGGGERCMFFTSTSFMFGIPSRIAVLDSTYAATKTVAIASLITTGDQSEMKKAMTNATQK